MRIIDTESSYITKVVNIIYHDTKKYKRIKTITRTKIGTGGTPITDIEWFATEKDLLEPVKPKEWKTLNFNDGIKLEKVFQSESLDK